MQEKSIKLGKELVNNLDLIQYISVTFLFSPICFGILTLDCGFFIQGQKRSNLEFILSISH